jgi:hypothetical protein
MALNFPSEFHKEHLNVGRSLNVTAIKKQSGLEPEHFLVLPSKIVR